MGVRVCVSVLEVAVVVVDVVVAVGVATGGRIVCVPGRASQSTMWQRLSRCPASSHTHGIASSVGWQLQQSTLHQAVPLRWEPTAAC